MEIAKMLPVTGGETKRFATNIAHGARRLLFGRDGQRTSSPFLFARCRDVFADCCATLDGRRSRQLGRTVIAVLLYQVAQITGPSNVQLPTYTTNGRPLKLTEFIVHLRRRLHDCFSSSAKNITIMNY